MRIVQKRDRKPDNRTFVRTWKMIDGSDTIPTTNAIASHNLMRTDISNTLGSNIATRYSALTAITMSSGFPGASIFRLRIGIGAWRRTGAGLVASTSSCTKIPTILVGTSFTIPRPENTSTPNTWAAKTKSQNYRHRDCGNKG